MAKELKLIKGNQAIAEAAIRCGCDGYFGYPITPQSEVLEHLMAERPYLTTGMAVLQAESELASINMVYAGASTGKRVMTSSSSPGFSLMQEGLTYLAGAELPALCVNVVRGGPGLGTIQPAQSDYFQTTKGGGHGDYRLITLAPASVQEMYDFVELGFDLAFKYRNPVAILSDGVIGQVMEKVMVDDYKPRWTNEYIEEHCPWAATGHRSTGKHRIVTSLELEALKQEAINDRIQEKYRRCQEEDTRYEAIQCDDAEYIFVAYGSAARICMKAVELARAEGLKVGLVRPITLWPFPTKAVAEIGGRMKKILCVEMSAGQMIEDVKLAVDCNIPVEHFGRYGGVIPTPVEIFEAMKNMVK